LNAFASELVLHDAGGLIDVSQFVHVVLFAHAVSEEQHDVVRHVSHAATPVVKPHVPASPEGPPESTGGVTPVSGLPPASLPPAALDELLVVPVSGELRPPLS